MASITFYPAAPYEQWAPALRAILTPLDDEGNYEIDEADFIKMWAEQAASSVRHLIADGHEFIIKLKD